MSPKAKDAVSPATELKVPQLSEADKKDLEMAKLKIQNFNLKFQVVQLQINQEKGQVDAEHFGLLERFGKTYNAKGKFVFNVDTGLFAPVPVAPPKPDSEKVQ